MTKRGVTPASMQARLAVAAVQNHPVAQHDHLAQAIGLDVVAQGGEVRIRHPFARYPVTITARWQTRNWAGQD